jgi:Prenylcysteine lyase
MCVASDEDGGGERLGIWNGDEFVFETSDYTPLTMLRGLWRYGLASVTVQGLVSEVLERFLQVYDLLEKERDGFESVEQLLKSLNLFELSQQSLQEYLAEEGISPLYCNELITGVNRVNYGQDNSLNALVGLVSIIGNTDELAAVRCVYCLSPSLSISFSPTLSLPLHCSLCVCRSLDCFPSHGQALS